MLTGNIAYAVLAPNAVDTSNQNVVFASGSAGDVSVEDGAGGFTKTNLISTITAVSSANDTTLDLAGVETITGNWVNTANPWADNEVSDTITVGASGSVDDGAIPAGITRDTEIDTSAKVAGIVTDETGTGALVFGTQPVITYHTQTITTTTDTLVTSDRFVHVDDDTAGSEVTITLPAVSGNAGLTYYIKKTGSTANVVVDGSGVETIDGATTATLTAQYESLHIVCDGTEWWIH